MFELSLSAKDHQSSHAKKQLLDWAMDQSLVFAETLSDSDLASIDELGDLDGNTSVFDPASVVFYLNSQEELIDLETQTKRLWPDCFSYSARKIHDSGWSKAWLDGSQQNQLTKTKIILMSDSEGLTSSSSKLTAEEASETVLINDLGGRAFGNGLHRATNVLLHWLEQTASRPADFPITRMNVLDVGFGTGVLAIKAKKLGFKTVVGTEIDSNLVSLGETNAKLNNINDIVFLMAHELDQWCQARELKGFDLVLCNVQTPAQLSLHDMFQKILVEGGILVTSGFMEPDVPLNVENLSKRGFEPVSVNSDHGWVVCEFIKQN
jgi:ribosomal protein L11 methylase PrmA